MVTLFFYSFFIVNAIVALVHPWIGAINTYLVGILSPQTIWWWHFGNTRPYYWVTLPLIVGSTLAFFRNKLNLRYLKTPINLAVLCLVISFLVSYFFGPYINVKNQYRFFEPEPVLFRLLKNFLIFYLTIILIDNQEKAKCLCLVIIVVVIYYIYWANYQYLSGQQIGRLHGPRGIYHDENVFAVLFVIGMPFLFYFGSYLESKPLRYLIWAVIPFGWHAIFLTGSRGGMLGLLASLSIISLKYSKKWIKIGIIFAFSAAFIWQGGDLMQSRVQTLEAYQTDHSAEERIEAWKAAIKMVEAHPFTGVGLASMGQAYPFFSNYQYVRVAHNTFFQLSAESGMIAGLSFLFLIGYPIKKLWHPKKEGASQGLKKYNTNKFLFALREACLSSIVGFAVCAMFLSLQEYEMFYYLIILANFSIVETRLRQ